MCVCVDKFKFDPYFSVLVAKPKMYIKLSQHPKEYMTTLHVKNEYIKQLDFQRKEMGMISKQY